MPVSSSGTPPFVGWFIAWAIFVVVVGIVSFAIRAAVLRRGGLNPFVAKEQLEVKASQGLDRYNSGLPAKTIEVRLAELDDLHSRGVISDEERTTARAKVIAGDR